MHSATLLSLAAALGAALVSGHATANPKAALAGSYFATGFRISHGCNGTATTEVTIKVPEGVTSVKAKAVPGWAVSTTTRALNPPVTQHGKQVTTTVDTVKWTAAGGSELPDSMFEDFWLSVKLPAKDDGKDSQALYWPVTQKCVTGQWEWVSTPESNEAESKSRGPAPVVTMYGDAYGVLGVNKTMAGGDAAKSGAAGSQMHVSGMLAAAAVAAASVYVLF